MADEKRNKEVQIHYQKNPLYREIYTDGGIGSVTPNGLINICFYATRRVIPKSITYEIEESGIVGKETQSEDSKKGVVREIEFGVYLDKQTARQLHEFLSKVLEQEKSI